MNRWQISSFEEQVMAGIWENSRCSPLDRDPPELELSDVNPASRKAGMGTNPRVGNGALNFAGIFLREFLAASKACHSLQAWNDRARNIKAEGIQP